MRKGSKLRLRWFAVRRFTDGLVFGSFFRRMPSLPGFDVTLEFLEDWYYSRPFQLSLLAFPAAAAVICGMILFGQALVVSQERLVREYEQRADQMAGLGDLRGQELCLRATAELQPNNPVHRVRLGILLDSSGRREDARKQMQIAAELPDSTVPEASIWLARDQLRNGSDPASLQEAERRLLEAVAISPRNDATRRELADFLESRGEILLAEQSLTLAASIQPLNYPALLQWQLRRQRPDATIQKTIASAVRQLQDKLTKSPDDEMTRIALSEVHAVVGNFTAAQTALGGSKRIDEYSNAMRGAWSSLHLLHAQWLLQRSPLNRDAVLPLVAQSLDCDPFHIDALELAENLAEAGSQFPANSFDRPLQALRTLRNDGRSDWNTVSTLLRLQLLTRYKPTEDELPSEPKRPGQRLLFAQLLLKCGYTDAARRTAQTLLEELRKSPENDSEQRLAAQGLLILDRPGEALKLLQSQNQATAKASPAVQRLTSRASLALVDQIAENSADRNPEQELTTDPVTLLQPVLDDPAFALAALERLATLALQSSPDAAAAQQLLAQLRTDGRFTTEIPSMLGAYALQQERFADAVHFLNAAMAVTGQSDPGLQNNLALALVRHDSENAEEALELIEAALEQHPLHPDLLATRGEVCAALGRWHDAVDSLTAALPARRSDPQLQRLLEQASIAMKNNRTTRRRRPNPESLPANLTQDQSPAEKP